MSTKTAAPADAIRSAALNIGYLTEGLNEFNLEFAIPEEDRSEANTLRVREGMIASINALAQQIAENAAKLGAYDGAPA